MAVFAESGYRGGSLKEIADRVGLSQAGLLHHFSSKEHLLAEVIALRDASDQARRFAESTPSGRDALAGLAEQVRHNTTVPGLVQLYVTLSGEAVAEGHPAHTSFVERYRALRRYLGVAVAEGQRAGDVDPALDPAVIATALIALMDGLQIQWLLDPAAVDMPTVVESYLKSLGP
ncbi:TetR/AcrR family transcriptional regulator [Cryptosporangium phraense]|uniref:TetR/AcrR family transcriptional regulator n=2 Tax=Cryptosporangium phraense TaxID=2593070 RepID=A0A545AY11_9ACTN|nr:TetR/AcrR family transcriptional regulator [Cryptosporangium phraense]